MGLPYVRIREIRGGVLHRYATLLRSLELGLPLGMFAL